MLSSKQPKRVKITNNLTHPSQYFVLGNKNRYTACLIFILIENKRNVQYANSKKNPQFLVLVNKQL